MNIIKTKHGPIVRTNLYRYDLYIKNVHGKITREIYMIAADTLEKADVAIATAFPSGSRYGRIVGIPGYETVGKVIVNIN